MPSLVRSARLPACCRKFAQANSGVTAIEFAFVAPIFFLFLFGILELGLIVFFSSLLNDAAAETADYLRNETMTCVRQGSASNNCTAANAAGIRTAACKVISSAGMSCDTSKLKIAVYNADDPVATPIPATAMIDEVAFNLNNSRRYVIALGYEWDFVLPTSKLLLPHSGDRVQMQARIFATTAERALR